MKKIILGVATFAIAMGTFSCIGGGKTNPSTQQDSISYAVGLLEGNRMLGAIEQSQEAEEEDARINKEDFLKGYKDGIKDPKQFSYFAGAITATQTATYMIKDSIDLDLLYAAFESALKADSANYKMTDEKARDLMQIFQQKKQQKAIEEAQRKAQEEKDKGAKFIEEFKKEEGVQVTESGLAYKVLTPGTGATPTEADKVKVNYKGTLINGEEFDANEGIELGVNQVVKGWTEMLQLMKVGEKVKVVIPSDLAYGDQGSYKIPGGATLVFEMELLDIVKK